MAENPGAGAAGADPSEEAGGRGGMSTGAKVFFACLGVAVVGFVLAAIAVGVLGVGIWRGTESIREGVAGQQEASRVLEEVEAEHPFEPPEDGVVGEERLERFLAVTETAWEEIRPWAEDLRQIRETARGARGGGSA
ncbi:MAG TPA: hypothetical protein VLL48_07370, partial [Longimicrobiales bacterium]|nr:hypothetical protein [Longimicrobiales bacterium]